MQGLVQIQVVGIVTNWFVIALRDNGSVWRGEPGQIGNRWTIRWTLLEEP